MEYFNTLAARILAALLLVTADYLYATPSHSWLPKIENFGSETGCGAATWKVATLGDRTFFADERGVLACHGDRWELYPLLNRGEARSVAVAEGEGRIYVGGENEYGYLAADPCGRLRYHCISDTMPPAMRDIGNVFDIYPLGDWTIFRADNLILTLGDGAPVLTPSPDKIHCSAMMGDALWLGTASSGVLALADGTMSEAEGCAPLRGKRVSAMIPFKDGMLIATATDGIYYHDGSRLTRFETEADRILDADVVNCLATQGHTLAIGTINSGIVTTGLSGEGARVINELSGLQTNTVMCAAFDADGNLWAGLSRGVSRVELMHPVSDLYRAPMSYGIGYSALPDGDRLYLGTDRGLYRTAWPAVCDGSHTEISAVGGIPPGPVWKIFRGTRGEILMLHDKGVYLLGTDGRAARVTGLSGVWSAATAGADRYLIGDYEGVSLMTRDGGVWSAVPVSGITRGARHMAYDPATRTLTLLNPTSGRSSSYRLSESLTEAEETEAADTATMPDSEIDITDRFAILPGIDGFGLRDRSRKGRHRFVSVEKITVFPADTAVYASSPFGTRAIPRISYGENTLRMEFAAGASGFEGPVMYRCRLDGDEWSAPTPIGMKEYTDLREGRYLFEVEATFADGTVATDSVEFVILPPWYRTWVALAVYALLLCALAILLVRIERRRVITREEQAEKRLRSEIDTLEKEKLDLALRHKSSELANSMLNITRKNEILTEIKEDLKECLSASTLNPTDTRRRLAVVCNKIEDNISGDDILRRFEEEFDLVNDGFIKKLAEKHPELRRNERLLAAYLKMGLSTKEIAPLLNISVRGVETMRYRLRKKMGLERGESIA